MNSLQLNAEFLRDLSIIAEDEALSAQLMKYIKKLVAKKPDPTLMTKEEFFAGIEEAERQIERGNHNAPERIFGPIPAEDRLNV